jgi:hypothetical protein
MIRAVRGARGRRCEVQSDGAPVQSDGAPVQSDGSGFGSTIALSHRPAGPSHWTVAPSPGRPVGPCWFRSL